MDGAFGAVAYWSDRLEGPRAPDWNGRTLLPSICISGPICLTTSVCVLVRDAEAHKAAFATGASYLTAMARGPAAGGLRFADRNIELSRGFRALKAWMSLKGFGSRRDHCGDRTECRAGTVSGVAGEEIR